jgi:tetratricopeptide (TPR) repeat protein
LDFGFRILDLQRKIMFLAKYRRTLIIIGLVGGVLFTLACGKQNPVAEVQASAADPQIRAAEDMIRLMPDSPRGYNQIAAFYIKQARRTGDFSLNTKAESAVNKALELDTEDIQARKLAASLQLTFHRFENALELGTKLGEEFPNDAFVYGVLTDANAELGNYDAAVKAVQKMVDLKPNASSYARVAHIRSLYGNTEGAIEAMKTAARTADPQDAEEQSWCLVQLGDEFRRNGKYAEAEKVYTEALSILPDFYLALAGKGKVRAMQGDLEAGVRFLTESQNRVPNVDTVIALGDIYMVQGNTDKAHRQYDLVEIIEQKLGVAGDQKRLALMWADQNIKLDEALAIAEGEYSARKDIYTADVYAWCLYKKGQLAEAKAAIDRAMALKTKDARILYHAGMIEKGLGEKRQAARLLKAALELDPKFDLLQAVEAEKALKEVPV